MLARLGKTLSTNAAIGGLALLVLGAGGTTASLVAGNSPAPTPNSHANANATDAADNADDADENADDAAEEPEAVDATEDEVWAAQSRLSGR